MIQILPYAFFLLCPASMGIMMWVMMRGMNGSQQSDQLPPDQRIDQLEREVQALRNGKHGQTPEQAEVK